MQGFLLHPSTNIDLPLKNERILDWELGGRDKAVAAHQPDE